MAIINDYSTLQSTVADYLARADLTNAIPGFVQMAEIRMNRDIRAPWMVVSVSGTTVSGGQILFSGLTTGYNEAIALSVNVGGVECDIPPVATAKALNQSLPGVPYAYAVTSSGLELMGAATEYAYTLTYYRLIGPVSSDTAAILKIPDAYLYATLMEAEPYIQDDQRMTIWSAGYQQSVNAINGQMLRQRFPTGSRARVDFIAP